MKKSLLFVFALIISVSAYSQNAGFYERKISINANGTNSDVNGVTGSGSAVLGTFDGTSGVLELKGGHVKTFKSNSNGNICGPIMFYRVFTSGSPTGAFTSVALSYDGGFGNQSGGGGTSTNQQWDNDAALSVNLLSGRINGTYTVEVYYQTTGSTSSTSSCSETIFDSNSSGNYRFDFTITNSPLPVVLTKFSGKAVDKNINLSWETAAEQGNDFFQVQKSADLKSWESIGEVKGKGTIEAKTEYNFVDEMAQTGMTHYYRLKQVDFNGNFEYSKSIAVKMNSNPMLQVFPNPTTEFVQISGIETPTTLQLIDAKGLVIEEKQIDKNERLEVKNRNSGIYFVRIFDATSSQSKRIVVQ